MISLTSHTVCEHHASCEQVEEQESFGFNWFLVDTLVDFAFGFIHSTD